MQWDEKTRQAMEVELNEADVLGIRLEPSGAWCDVLLHVVALPKTGPIDPDTRRILAAHQAGAGKGPATSRPDGASWVRPGHPAPQRGGG